jgi:hypothetical protein
MAKLDVMQTLREAESVAIEELKAIRTAISAIAGTSGIQHRGERRGRPRKAATGGKTIGAGRRKRRKLSAAARKRISDAQKARWARQKSGKN